MACDKFVIIVLQSGRLEVTDKSVFLGLLQKLTVTDPTVTVQVFPWHFAQVNVCTVGFYN